jgi:RNA polymerase sigma-70 factor (ECF subfamily)
MEEEVIRYVVMPEMDASLDTIRMQMVALLPRMRRFALSLTANATEADDLVQDTVERALRGLHLWQRGTRLDSWMFRIAQNLWIDRKRAAKVRAEVAGDPEAALGVAVDGARAQEARLTFADTCAALEKLPDEQRVAVALVLIDGQSYRDAAATLGIPIGTLTSRLARARSALAMQVFG